MKCLFFCVPEGSGARQELLELTVGQKLTLAVEEVLEEGGATFKSDQLAGVAIAASKHHVLGGSGVVGEIPLVCVCERLLTLVRKVDHLR